jgi:hypothetical protein
MSLLKGGDFFLLLFLIIGVYFYLSNISPNSKIGKFRYNILVGDSLVLDIASDIDTILSVNGVDIEIENGVADVVHSTCRNRICEKTTPINDVGERIVCVPNKVIIIAVGRGELDAIAE